jgi:hypothetical protein
LNLSVVPDFLAIGWLGLAVFLAILAEVAYLLWQGRKDNLSLVLFAALLGITFINLLSHAWTDDTLAFIWWGLAALALGTPALPRQTSSKAVTLPKQRKHSSAGVK